MGDVAFSRCEFTLLYQPNTAVRCDKAALAHWREVIKDTVLRAVLTPFPDATGAPDTRRIHEAHAGESYMPTDK
jgi:hypothetical protein